MVRGDSVSRWERPPGPGCGALPVTQSSRRDGELVALPLCPPARFPPGEHSPGQNTSPSRFWFRRRGGDVIVIGLEKDASGQRGRVIAVLKARELTPRG